MQKLPGPPRPNSSRPGYLEIDGYIDIRDVAPDNIIIPPKGSSHLRNGPFGINRAESFVQNRATIVRTINELEQAYQVRSSQLSQTLEADLAAVRSEGPNDPVAPLPSLVRELRVLNTLHQRKTAELHSKTAMANAFYGGDPFNWNIHDFMLKATKREYWPGPNGIAMQALNQSLRAAIDARLLNQTLQSLQQRTISLQHTFSVMQADEQARLATEQAALRIAAEQARIRAEAEALVHAQEQARLAALADAERVAAEQARIAAEAAAQYFAAEQARLEAEAEVQRQAEQLRLENERQAEEQALREAMESSNSVQGPFAISGAAAASGPVFTLATGRLATNTATTLAIRTSLQTGATAVMTAAATSASVVLVGFAALLFPSPLGDGESRQLNVPLRDLVPDDMHAWSLSLEEYEPDNLHALSIPLSDLTFGEFHDLHAIAEANGEIELPVAIGSKSVGNTTEFFVAATNGISVSGKVPVRLATYDPNLNLYTAYNPDAPSIGMTWTPIVRPSNASTYFPASAPNTAVYDGTTLTALEGRTDSFPELDLYSFGGFITVFPAESGIPPTFTMFRDRRGEPGVASGYGEPISGIWLGPASQGDGAVIPNQIADKLRGRDFPNFRAFREALWKAAANDPELSKQFSANNIEEMKHGRAPFSRKNDRVGGQVKFEMHHVNHISKGGEVYDIDNIRVVTPKRHSELHKGGK
ncbi:S-type pyocin domain-containing protein [Pseudomonas sp. MAG733B]|uniref:S-type pyocin domain-containing protein n=1 Tax=Pseudomonas sp. MAG733B TaxID=3122079 RepID=UPI0030D5AF20